MTEIIIQLLYGSAAFLIGYKIGLRNNNRKRR